LRANEISDLLAMPLGGHAVLPLGGHAVLPLNLLVTLTLLSLAPLLLVMCTSFVRIVVVLSLVRSAIGASALPPNAVLTGLALILTFVVMAPTGERIRHDALEPYARGAISPSQAMTRALAPLRSFMTRQARSADVALFERIAHRKKMNGSVPLRVLIPAFVVGELRSAFAIGFALYLPFVAIDLAVAAMLMALGMMMLSPPVVSLPLKLLLFVMVDGWAILCGGVAASFR
jgi:flagellar biosynthesis protein FliP